MEEPTSRKTADSTNPAKDPSAGGQQPKTPASGTPLIAPPDQTVAGHGIVSAGVPLHSVKFVSNTLEKAELLLGYAAETGIEIEDKVRDGVLNARIACEGGGITEQTAANLLAALTQLAAIVRPVTVESLKSCADPRIARKPIRLYGTVAVVTGCVIVVFSLLTFVSNSISDKIKADVETANGLASKLRAELGPPPSANQSSTNATAGTNNAANLPQDEVWFGPGGIPPGLSDKDVLSDLQQFAATMREINGYARQLKYCLFDFTPNSQTNHAALELTPGLNVRLSRELTDKVEEYQKVRSFGNKVQERVTVYYGAIATCILPVLYALLGAVAYLLRSYENQFKNRTLIAGDRHIARFLIAGIGGLVVGLFNTVTQGISISPFAVAFLVGYAVDVFFAFLEGLLQMFKRGPGDTAAPGTPPKP